MTERMNDTMVIDLLSVSDVANHLERSPQLVRTWARDNCIPKKYRLAVLLYAQKRGLELDKHFLIGANR